jgi:hypothetical protein
MSVGAKHFGTELGVRGIIDRLLGESEKQAALIQWGGQIRLDSAARLFMLNIGLLDRIENQSNLDI